MFPWKIRCHNKLYYLFSISLRMKKMIVILDLWVKTKEVFSLPWGYTRKMPCIVIGLKHNIRQWQYVIADKSIHNKSCILTVIFEHVVLFLSYNSPIEYPSIISSPQKLKLGFFRRKVLVTMFKCTQYLWPWCMQVDKKYIH